MEKNQKELKEAELVSEKIDRSNYELKEEVIDKNKKEKINDESKIWRTFFFIMVGLAFVILLVMISGDINEEKDCSKRIESAQNTSFQQGYGAGYGEAKSEAQGINKILSTCNGMNCSMFCINQKDFWYVKNDSILKCEVNNVTNI